VFGYQQASSTYVLGAPSSFATKTLAGAAAFTGFASSTNTMVLSLTKSAGTTGATSGLGQATHCIVQFILSK
jgi:hypothetical protein